MGRWAHLTDDNGHRVVIHERATQAAVARCFDCDWVMTADWDALVELAGEHVGVPIRPPVLLPTVIGAADCEHLSATGIDQTEGPEKVWRCDACGWLYRMAPAEQPGISRMVPA